jgi:hypothetical protein
MNYPIPDSPQEIFALKQKPVDEELVASAIAGVIRIVRSQGQSLEELTAQLLADDSSLGEFYLKRQETVLIKQVSS